MLVADIQTKHAMGVMVQESVILVMEKDGSMVWGLPQN